MAFVSFDHLKNRFAGQIYDSQKGRLRMRLIDELYRSYLPLPQLEQMRVLDAAGGLGQMSHWFLEMGAQVDYFDVSAEMVVAAETTLESWRASGLLNCTQASITDFQPKQCYDLVNAHAVLEWLEQPMPVLQQMLTWVAPGGFLGLMVYNKHMLMLRHLMRGTLKRAMAGDIAGDKRGLTPISPLEPVEVRSAIENAGFKVLCQAGVRSFSDLTEKTILNWYDEDEVFQAELSLCQQRPYMDMARYVLFIAQKD